jgi:hypothetical protein
MGYITKVINRSSVCGDMTVIDPVQVTEMLAEIAAGVFAGNPGMTADKASRLAAETLEAILRVTCRTK